MPLSLYWWAIPERLILPLAITCHIDYFIAYASHALRWRFRLSIRYAVIDVITSEGCHITFATLAIAAEADNIAITTLSILAIDTRLHAITITPYRYFFSLILADFRWLLMPSLMMIDGWSFSPLRCLRWYTIAAIDFHFAIDCHIITLSFID